MRNIDIFKDYENAKLSSVEEYKQMHADKTYKYSEISEKEINGIPISVTRNGEGELELTFIDNTHLLCIGATRSGKTTGYVIPTLNVLLKKKNKPSIVISDPKGELFLSNAAKFEREGYRVITLDFTDYRHSDCWNPLTKYFRQYKKCIHVDDEIEVVDTPNGPRNKFRGVVYEDQTELDLDLNEVRAGYFDEVEKGITSLSQAIIPTLNTRDPFWEDSARDLLCAILYGMLEDSENGGGITEDNYSFDTLLRIFDTFSDTNVDYDNGYFTKRDIKTSKAFQLANKCIIEQAKNTRCCISSSFAAKMSKFRDTSVRRITCANTFEMSELDDAGPAVIFVSYKDEDSLHYEIISMFLSNLYTELISIARKKNSKLDRPFYFLLDEFGNLPKFNDFEKVISACGGRDIWFLLILQSYAQLYNIYGKDTAEIIKDNLNTHVFFGTNNPQTKREFSEECGKKTIISPISALGGKGESIDRYEKDTVALVPVSSLISLSEGECFVTQMRENVLRSRIERSYTCPEFTGNDEKTEYKRSKLRFSDPKYQFDIDLLRNDEEKKSKKGFNPFDDLD